MTTAPEIRPAGPEDAARLHEAIDALARHLGVPERMRATPEDYARHGLHDGGLFRAVLAEAGGTVCGAATCFPEFSTLRGQPGVYLQDLWVAEDRRGSGLGRRLLARVVADAAAWEARYMKLSAHLRNAEATAFYHHLGFASDPDELSFVIEGDGYADLERGG